MHQEEISICPGVRAEAEPTPLCLVPPPAGARKAAKSAEEDNDDEEEGAKVGPELCSLRILLFRTHSAPCTLGIPIQWPVGGSCQEFPTVMYQNLCCCIMQVAMASLDIFAGCGGLSEGMHQV